MKLNLYSEYSCKFTLNRPWNLWRTRQTKLELDLKRYVIMVTIIWQNSNALSLLSLWVLLWCLNMTNDNDKWQNKLELSYKVDRSF